MSVTSRRAIHIGWCAFVAHHATLCLCGHPEWEHTGLNEPGCSHAGECVCLRFRR